MVKVKIYLRKKVSQEWFLDFANEIRDEIGESGIWIPSEKGIVWTHYQHGGKVRFLKQYENDADFVKISHPSQDRFKQAQAVADFIQWVYHRAEEYVGKIEIPVL